MVNGELKNFPKTTSVRFGSLARPNMAFPASWLWYAWTLAVLGSITGRKNKTNSAVQMQERLRGTVLMSTLRVRIWGQYVLLGLIDRISHFNHNFSFICWLQSVSVDDWTWVGILSSLQTQLIFTLRLVWPKSPTLFNVVCIQLQNSHNIVSSWQQLS